jgi:signal peptidase II
MNRWTDILQTPRGRVAAIATGVVVSDQITKLLVIKLLGFQAEKVIIPGFFKFVHWGNTGAAWSLFTGNNHWLIVVAAAALVVLYLSRHYFDVRSPVGLVSFGLLYGGIIGNLIDRIRVKHVIDFIYFYMERANGQEIGFPAFNIADSAICVGVGLIFYNTWRAEAAKRAAEAAASGCSQSAPVGPEPPA